MEIKRVLVVGGDEAMQDAVKKALASTKVAVRSAQSAAGALDLLRDTTFDLLVTATLLPGLRGLELFHKVREMHPFTSVVLASDCPSVDEAIEALQAGALDYLTQPLCAHRLLQAADKAFSAFAPTHRGIIAVSSAMQEVLATAKQVAQTDATVLLSGESGTGKELLAHAIHAHSVRKRRPYIAVNCAAIPDTLIESEFFGHERGAFTGAHARKLGRFETAHRGTLLLDEVTEIPLAVQPKLLRALQEQQFERVGGTTTVSVDVRLIATSNRNLDAAIANGHMREDLYYRLNVIPIHVPPLRDRKEDIIPLAETFLGPTKQLSKEAVDALLAHPWPGNVRELANVIARTKVLCPGETISNVPL